MKAFGSPQLTIVTASINAAVTPHAQPGTRSATARPFINSAARAAMSDTTRYGVDVDSCLVNLYRDGHDAVAWHGDTVRKLMPTPHVFTVSLGVRRRFELRHRRGGPVVRTYLPGEGDLIVMGGRTQHEWLHAVPRDRRVSGARMSVTFRHSRPGMAEGSAGR